MGPLGEAEEAQKAYRWAAKEAMKRLEEETSFRDLEEKDHKKKKNIFFFFFFLGGGVLFFFSGGGGGCCGFVTQKHFSQHLVGGAGI